MRVALLSSIELLNDPDRALRASARIGGQTVLRRQLDFALQFGCERIACLSDTMHPELIELQHVAERAGASFHPIRDARPLAGLVKSDDRLLIIGDGVLFDHATAKLALGEGRRILTFAAGEAVPLGFERLDRDRAWAGLMLVSGSLVERLSDMPSDIDPQSSLLRLALQGGVLSNEVDPLLLAQKNWALINSVEAASRFEENWLSNSISPATAAGPVSAASDYAALAVLKRHFQPRKAAHAVGAIAVVLLITAVMLGWMDYPIAGLAAVFFVYFAGRFSGTLSLIMRDGAENRGMVRWWGASFAVLIDLTIVALIAVSAAGSKRIGAAFAALVLIGLLRVVVAPDENFGGSSTRDLFEDRGLLVAVLVIAAVFGKIVLVSQLLGLLTLAYLVFRSHFSKLTQT